MAKLELPDALKAEVPPTLWGRILIATPVVMTVVATALAGLASSEMTRAQYCRSLAAQQQSKAGDQWGFFQAKRLRGALQRSTLDVLRSTGPVRLPDTATLAQSGAAAASIAALQQGQVPEVGPAPSLDDDVAAALLTVENFREVPKGFSRVSDAVLEDALQKARNRAQEFDVATKPVNQFIERIEDQAAGEAQVARDLIAARLRYTAARYEAEARLNQSIAYLYELQVRKSNLDAERHHRRSQQFFYGMLAAQAAVIIATFSLAARQRNLLWALAAGAGAAAVSFAIYVYLFV